MQSENLLRSECGGYESDDSGGGRGGHPGPPGYYPPPQHQYQVVTHKMIIVKIDIRRKKCVKWHSIKLKSVYFRSTASINEEQSNS